MILKATLCVQHFCSFGAMLLNVNLLIRTDSTGCFTYRLFKFSLESVFTGKNNRSHDLLSRLPVHSLEVIP